MTRARPSAAQLIVLLLIAVIGFFVVYPLALIVINSFNVAGPGQSKECEAGNEPYKIGQAVIGNVPGNVGTKTEETERKNNLFGAEYPASTLEALGLKSSKGAKK